MFTWKLLTMRASSPSRYLPLCRLAISCCKMRSNSTHLIGHMALSPIRTRHLRKIHATAKEI